MRNIILIAIIAMFAFASNRVPSNSTNTSKPKEPLCGPVYVFTNPGGATVTKIVIDYSDPAYATQTYNFPTFPFNTTRCCGGTVTIIVYTSSGSGTITVTENATTLITCETFEAPHLSPVVFFGDCADYYVSITSTASCP